MGQSLNEIAQTLKDADKKVQLIYAFNGTGKTRLSREFKELIVAKEADVGEQEESDIKVLYYNAFTEDLFYWHNDLVADINRKLIIEPNAFTDLALNFLKDQGQDINITSHFQRYTNRFITPMFSEDFSEVTFSMQRGNDDSIENIKISRGEESNFIWCVFYSLLEQIVEILNEVDPTNRTTQDFNDLEYVFIDDPVSSLDDNHLIELAVNIAELVKSSPSCLHYIITTHNPLFYNILHNEFKNDEPRYHYTRDQSEKKRLEKLEDGTFSLIDSNDTPFSYHLFLLSELEKAIESGNIEKYHFNFLRNILEKMSTFLGYKKWKKLLPEGEKKEYYNRIINLYSHYKHHGDEVPFVLEEDKTAFIELVGIIKTTYHFRQG